MSKKVFVTGMGMISSIGEDVESSKKSLEELKTGVGIGTIIQTQHCENLPVAELKLSNQELADLIGIPYQDSFSRTMLLGMKAVQEALRNAQIENVSEARTGFISATSVGGMDQTELIYDQFLTNSSNTKQDILKLKGHECGESTKMIADFFNIKDYLATISTACSSAANAILLGARLIRNNYLDRVIVGGTDALSKFTVNGFNSLLILNNQWCSPFDANRKGLNLGEGAGYLVLESEQILEKYPKPILGSLLGASNTNDAYHQTASSPEGEGIFCAMKEALTQANLCPEQIDYVNAHGTGTVNNDETEGIAIQRLFEKVPYVSSTKAYTGHTLAAAAGIEAVISLLSMRENTIYPNLNYKTPMPELTFQPVTNVLSSIQLNYVMSNSVGFGGNTSSLIFSKK